MSISAVMLKHALHHYLLVNIHKKDKINKKIIFIS